MADEERGKSSKGKRAPRSNAIIVIHELNENTSFKTKFQRSKNGLPCLTRFRFRTFMTTSHDGDPSSLGFLKNIRRFFDNRNSELIKKSVEVIDYRLLLPSDRTSFSGRQGRPFTFEEAVEANDSHLY